MKFPFNITRGAYAMATTDGTSAEITLYGDIYEQRPVDWWTGEPVPGDFILLDDFLEDLKKVAGCKEITVRINSYGGDAGVSNTIHQGCLPRTPFPQSHPRPPPRLRQIQIRRRTPAQKEELPWQRI